MTSARAPTRRGALARRWRDFRRWRRGRPFWGGLLTMLAGLEILGSTQLTLGELQLRVGIEGFQAYIIPAALILAGLLTWVTPAQRIFYGVLGALISVYSLIGVNLGGFFIGMLLGIVGGSLAASWAPVRLPPPQPPADTDGTHPSLESGELRDDETGDAQPDSPMDAPVTGPLTDVLPTATTSPIPQPRPARELRDSPVDETHGRAGDPTDPHRSGNGESGPPYGPLPRRSPRLFAITLVPVALTAAALVTLPTTQSALTDACPTTEPTATPMVAEATPTEIPSPASEPEASASPTPSANQSTTPTPSPCASPTPTSTGPTPTPSAKPSTTPTIEARSLAAADDQPSVGTRPGRMTGTRLSMSGLSFDGIVDDLPTADGPIRVLQFSMDRAITNDFELQIPESDGTTTSLQSTELTVEGSVGFYTDRFTGKLFGGAEVTFTPEFPPPPVPSEIFFTDVDIRLVYVRGDVLDADDLTALSGV